jgi:hypothetical protein
MVARIQGLPDSWDFYGAKTADYRQVGNAFPPPVAAALARSIRVAQPASNRGWARLEQQRSPGAVVLTTTPGLRCGWLGARTANAG